MFVSKSQVYAFLLLTLLASQQSCSTHSPLQPPIPEQARETEGAEASDSVDATSFPEIAEVEQEATEPQQETRIVPPLSETKIVPPLSIVPAEKKNPPESDLAAPEKDQASSKTVYDTTLFARTFEMSSYSGWQYRQNGQSKVVGFEFSNHGGNRILPHRYAIEKNLFFSRDFQFRFDDRARQDIHLNISDWAPSRDRQFRLSEIMNSVMLFFPRRYLPAITNSRDRAIVTLPTGEKVAFDAGTYEILGGVFAEAPVDLNPDRAARKFPGVHYTGKGLVIRADSRGKDPRIGTMAMITTGSPDADCKKGAACNQCRVPSKDLWDQNSAVRFRFSTDEEFGRYLAARCGFGIPEGGPDIIMASPLKQEARAGARKLNEAEE
ncbi:MAG: hypothetical protein HY695_13990 [Deltaproteobacteria bacterium]|nr:hypothetical protein [Deltaproteobacteria bacterium]